MKPSVNQMHQRTFIALGKQTVLFALQLHFKAAAVLRFKCDIVACGCMLSPDIRALCDDTRPQRLRRHTVIDLLRPHITYDRYDNERHDAGEQNGPDDHDDGRDHTLQNCLTHMIFSFRYLLRLDLHYHCDGIKSIYRAPS